MIKIITISLLWLPVSVMAGPAIGQFEMKDLNVELGEIEFQSQNAHAFDQPDRTFAEDDGEFEFDENEYVRQRHALEVEVGVTEFMRTRFGVEFEKERFDEPGSAADANAFDALKLTEVAIEAIVVFLKPQAYELGVGWLTELEFPVQEADESSSLVIGPIFQYDMGDWQALTNLYGVYHYAGEDDGKWDFSYTVRLMYQATEHWGVAVEAYGTVDRLWQTGTINEEAELFGDHDQHRLGPIVYYSVETDFSPRRLFAAEAEESELNLGFGWFFGLNDNTPDHTIKWSVEYEF